MGETKRLKHIKKIFKKMESFVDKDDETLYLVLARERGEIEHQRDGEWW